MVLEKSPVLGGTTAMSSAGTWVPANHHMLAAGLEDSAEETLAYLRATAPPGWAKDEDELWQALAEQSAPMLRFLEDKTPLVFELVNHPDFYVEAPGGKLFGRMVSPTLISRYILGRWWNKVRPSVKPQYFTYKEMVGGILKDPLEERPAHGAVARLALPRRQGRAGQRADRRPDARLPRPWLRDQGECRREASAAGGRRGHRRGGGDRRQAADDPRAQGRRAGDRRLRLGAGLHAAIFPRHAS